MVHCEQCGAAAAPEVGSLEYCVDCGLYVCPRCWTNSRSTCAACARATGRRTRDVDQRLLRRVDRRLREVAGDCATLLSPRLSGEVASIDVDLACLKVKAQCAITARDYLSSTFGVERRSLLASLLGRIDRHAERANQVLDQTARLVAGRETSRARDLPVVPQQRTRNLLPRTDMASILGSHSARRGLAAAVVLLTALVVLPSVFDARTPRVGEGVLGSASGPSATAQSTEEPSPTSPPVATAVSTEVAVAFDEERIAEGLGPQWRVESSEPGAVSVVAYPTAFNRSARLAPHDGVTASACLQASQPLDIERLGVDVTLGTDAPVARVSLRDVDGRSVVQVEFNANGLMAVTPAQDPAVLPHTVAPNSWYRIEIDRGGSTVTLRPVQEAESPSDAISLDIPPTALADLCLSADGPAGSAVNFDNIEITGSSSEG